MTVYYDKIEVSPRIAKLRAALFAKLPQVEAARAVLLTEAYKQTESEPIIMRRAKAFAHILDNIPIIIREHELVVGSTTVAPRSCQTYPEYSFAWLEAEFDTLETRSADPFFIAEETKAVLREVHKYWAGKTNYELAAAYMSDEAKRAIEHNIFTPGNYFFNGVGHICVQYDKVLAIGYRGINRQYARGIKRAQLGGRGLQPPRYVPQRRDNQLRSRDTLRKSLCRSREGYGVEGAKRRAQSGAFANRGKLRTCAGARRALVP